MISQLTIQNFGLIDKLTIDFGRQLNILTGETGAGKSIIIDALRFALGERIDSTHIRDTGLSCSVEAVFDINSKELRQNVLLAEYFTDGDSTLIVNRSYLPDGKNKIKINGSSVTVSQLKEIGNHLVDFHGANDHQMLLSRDSHIGILDRLCSIDEIKDNYSGHYRAYLDTLKKIEEIKTGTQSRDRELDLLTHQIKELEEVPLNKEDYEDISQKQTRLHNSEKLYEHANNLMQILEDEKAGINTAIGNALITMRSLGSIDQNTAELSDKLAGIQANTHELLRDLRIYIDNLSFDPDEAKDINRKYDGYYDILRKYGPSIEDARDFYLKTKGRYDFLNNLEHNDEELKEKLAAIIKDLGREAQKITAERKKISAALKKTIEGELKELGMPHIQFECRVEKTEFNTDGQDSVTFFISPNAGEGLKPLSEIVSSGEAARVMLALKKALVKVDPIPVLIFDEIDAQIGGRLGTITGQKLRDLSKNRQVILITHLPQIASFADLHFKITKKVENNRTSTAIELLTKDTRIKELAKMMSGEKESAISVAHANDMLQKAQVI